MASLALFQRVLAWAAEQGMSVRDQLTEEQIVALERAFRGVEPWSFEQYQHLRAFAHALGRLNLPDLPARLSFGDTLQALDELRSAAVAAWPTHAAVADSTFSELSYAPTSAGITRVREANKASWREHAAHNKQLLLRGAERARGPRAVVIGAGKLYDIPLRQLAERFEQLLLVDIDAASLTESVKQVGLEPKLQARLSLLRADVTGINDVFVERARAALSLSDEAEVYAALLRLLHDYRIDEPPRLLPDDAEASPLDFACSSMVLSQLATPLTQYLEARFATRFPESKRTQALEFQVALGQFTHRVQHAHVRSLLAAAPCVALSSDIAEQYVGLDAHGNALQGAVFHGLLGAASLEALVPRLQAHSVLTAEWQWQHVVPSRSKPHGRTVRVAGVVAERN
ncbi:MAG TPA: hypothetical protein VG937_01375 [Polyangiaceae bacterium]|nr:hypothetical protein [Polyangiaceae bacterium]